MKASYKKHILYFKTPSGTSRGVLKEKETWFIVLQEEDQWGIGECGLFRGLSSDDLPEYEEKLQWVCDHINLGLSALLPELIRFPSIQFGLEQAFLSLASHDPFILFPTNFTVKEQPIPINGLIWMGNTEFMLEQIRDRISDGFRCIKLKIGALHFETELAVLRQIRNEYSKDQIELRVDANGAFGFNEVLDKLEQLAALEIHSIEQPIKAGNPEEMQQVCKESALPIALDEELIGVVHETNKQELLQTIQPHYIILKPSLVGGFKGSEEWINLADTMNIDWWITSALESNIGLNAIAQWTYTLNSHMPQGLGTGSLFTNNFESPLDVKNGQLIYRQAISWKTNLIKSLCT
ncbi:MAG: o-succinylbenzoate synthase [Eudoraea sp.]|nr:o-succinylbenzoate synthase [Eudoraea sp.]